MAEQLFSKPEPVHERVVVRPGELVAAFSIIDGVCIERELVDENGNPCDSVGKQLAEDKPKPVKQRKKKGAPT